MTSSWSCYSSDLDDKHDNNRGHSALVGQITNVLCFFRTLDSITKMRLLISYCYSLYGCIIWDITNNHVEQVCSEWRAGVHRVWGLPLDTYMYNVLIPLISNRLPLYDEIRKRILTVIQSCLLSDSDLVRFVTRHAVWFSHMSSPLGRNAFHCCRRFDVYLDTVN